MTDDQRRTVEALRDAGRSRRDVGAEVGLHHSTVSKLWALLDERRAEEEADDLPATPADLRRLAAEFPQEQLDIQVTIRFHGHRWDPAGFIPPAATLRNPHALVSGLASGLLRDLTRGDG